MKAYFVPVVILLFGLPRVGTTEEIIRGEIFPTTDEVQAARTDFLSLTRPLSYEGKMTIYSVLGTGNSFKIQLKGETKTFSDRHSAPALAHALWPFLNDPGREAEAVIVLMGKTGAFSLSVTSLTFVDSDDVGNWNGETREELIRSALMGCVKAAGMSVAMCDSWYPRIPLFDYAAVRRDSTNAILRAQAIEAMRAALREPVIKDNPAELEDILHCLAAIKAEEAIPEMMPFLFYDMRTKSDFRLRLEDFADPNSNAPPSFDPVADYEGIDIKASGNSFGWRRLAAIASETALNSVLSRMAQSTPEERLIGLGGGCIASVARSFLYYYESDRIRGTGGRPRKPWVVIEQWIAAHPDLTPEQVAALNEIAQGTRTWEPDYVPPPAQPPPPPSE